MREATQILLLLPTSASAAAAKTAAAAAESSKASTTPTTKSSAAHPRAATPTASTRAAKKKASAKEDAKQRASAEKEQQNDEQDEFSHPTAVLLNGLWCVCGLVLGQRDLGIVGDYLGHFAYRERDCAVVVAGLKVRNHIAADVAGFAVRQDSFETVTNLDAVFVIGDGKENHGVFVVAYLLSPLLPIFQWSSS
jgi:hypothetical protein